MNFLDLINEGKTYIYYYNSDCKNIDIFNNPNEYIKSYFGSGNKFTTLLIDNVSILNDVHRSTHMCSLYALGAIVAEKTQIKGLIENKYKNLIPKSLIEDYKNSYLYYWFLVSLFHDVGYGMQTIPELKYNLFTHFSSQRKLLKEIFKEDYYEGYQKMKINELFCLYIQKWFFQTNKYNRSNYYLNRYYHSNVYRKYFSFDNIRINNQNNQNNQNESNEYFEHGILGGMIFYNNFLKTFQTSIWNSNVIKDEFIEDYDNRIWFPEQIDIFKDLAFVVATHNLWKQNFESYNIPVRFKDIDLNNPVLFLLCLCDTIDPYKYLMKKTHIQDNIKRVLEGIEIDINYNNIVIFSPTILEYNIKECWYDKLKNNLESFMEIVVNIAENKTIISW